MTISEIQKQIAEIEAQQKQGSEMVQQGQNIVQQTAGALSLARAWLGKLLKAEDDAKASANAAALAELN